MKQLLDQANEKAQQIEDAKLSAVGMRNMVSAEIETRPEKLRDQARLIADKQEQLEVTCDDAEVVYISCVFINVVAKRTLVL